VKYAVEVLIKTAGGPQARAAMEGVGAGARGAAPMVEKLTHEMLGFELSLKGLGSLIGGALAGFSALSIGKQIFQEVKESQAALAQLQAAVNATGGAAGYSAGQLSDMADELSRLTGVDDEAIAGAEGLMLRYRRVGHEVFPQAMQAALDMSAALGIDLSSAAERAGKMLNDPMRGMALLKREGHGLSAAQEELMKKFSATGNIAGAQRIILEQLSRTYGGSAAAARDTLGGALEALKTSWGNLLERVGNGGGIFREVIEGMVKGLDWLADHWHMMEGTVYEVMANVLGIVGGTADTLLPMLEKIAKGIDWTVQLNPFQNAKTKKASADAVEFIGDLSRNFGTAAKIMAEDFHDKASTAFAAIGQGAEKAGVAVKGLGEDWGDMGRKAAEALAKAVAAAQLEEAQALALEGAERQGAAAVRAVAMAHEALAKVRAAGTTLATKAGQEIYRATLAAAQAKNRTEEWKDAQKELNKAEEEFGQSLAKASQAMAEQIGVSLKLKAALEQQNASLSAALGDITQQTAAVLGGPQAEAALDAARRLDDEVKRILDGSLRQLDNEAPAEFEARWNAAAKQVRAALRGLFSAEELKAYQAKLAELQQWIEEPVRQAAATMENQMLDAIARIAAGGKVSFKDLWQSFLEMAIRAVEEWLVRFIAAQRIAQIEATRTAAIQAAGSSGAGGGTAYSSLFSMGSQAAASQGAGKGGGMFYSSGSGVTALGYFAIFVAILAAIKNWSATKGTPKVTGELAFGGPGGVSVGDITGNKGTTGAMKQMHAALDKLVQAVKDFIHSLGGEIEATFSEGAMYITKKGRGKKTHWIVTTIEGMVRDFGRDQEAAMQYAMVQAIKATPTTGLSPEVSAAIHNSVAETMDALQADIAAAVNALHARLGEVGSRVYDVIKGAEAEAKKLRELGIAEDAVLAARDREIESMRYQAIGIDMSAANFLAGMVSFNRGIEEATQAEQARINAEIAMRQAAIANGPQYDEGRRGMMSAEQWQQEVARLQTEIDQYTAQLGRIPQALSRDEMRFGAFQTLMSFIPQSRKYEEERVKWARYMLNLQLQAVKAQLIAGGLWDEFGAMWQEIYDQAMHDAGKSPKGGGGGANRQEARASALDQLAAMRAAAAGSVAETVNQWTVATREWDKQAKEAKLTTAQRTEGERLLREEMQRNLRTTAEGYAGRGQSLEERFASTARFFNDLAALGADTSGMSDAEATLLRTDANARFAAEALNALGDSTQSAVDRLGTMASAMAFLRAHMDELGISAERLGDIAAQTSSRLTLEIAGGLEQYVTSEETKRQLAEMKFRLDLAQYGILIETAHGLGFLLEADYQFLLGVLDEAGKYKPALAAVEVSTASLASSTDDLADAQNRLAEAQKNAASQVVDLMRTIAESNRALLTDSSRSALSPTDQLAAAKALYEETYLKAKAGDVQALKDYVGVRQTALDLQRQFSKSGPEYAAFFEKVFREGAGLVLGAETEQNAIANLIQEQMNDAAQAAAQSHEDLMGIRDSVIASFNDLARSLGQGVILNGMPRFAAGGIATRPSLAGEGRYPEAIIPLPSGAVPVRLHKAGGDYDDGGTTEAVRASGRAAAAKLDLLNRNIETMSERLGDFMRRVAAIESSQARLASLSEGQAKRAGAKGGHR
jgi:tail length tape measure protein